MKKKAKKLYTCKICKFEYKEKKWADKCYTWCSKHPSCNILITKHAAH